jgi:hypothetical protein
MEQREPDRLLQLRIAVHPYVGAVPEVVQVGPLLGEQAPEPGVAGGGQCRGHLVPQRRPGPQAGPAVREQLHQAQPLAPLQPADDRRARPVRRGDALHPGVAGRLDLVVHVDRHLQPAAAGAVHQHRAAVVDALLHGQQWVLQDGGDPRVTRARRARLVGDELRLHDQAHRTVDGLHRVLDRGDRALRERHQPGRPHPYPAARR